MKATVAFALTLLLLTSAAAAAQRKPDKQERAAMALTAEQVSLRLEVKGEDDPLEPTIWVSTRPFLEARFASDKFLRANIDKASGEAFYQLYLRGIFPQAMRFDRMTYLVAGKLQNAKAERIAFDVSCQRYGCSYYEDYVVEIKRSDLEALASDGEGPLWKARLFGQTVEGTDVEVLRNETAGLLLAVDRTLAKLQQPQNSN